MTVAPDDPSIPTPNHQIAKAPDHQPAQLWMPPQRLRRYQFAKAGGALIAGIIFTGWLVIQWSNLTLRVIAIALLAVTAWITVASIVSDLTRARGRQIAIDRARITITTPRGTQTIALADIARARWREDDLATAGLWLLDADSKTLAHLDLDFLGDQSEARAFLHWARDHAELRFPIDWPPTA